MSQRTARFGLNYYGGGTSGSALDDGEKYTSTDRLLLDRILAAIEVHDYHRAAGTVAGMTLLQPEQPLASVGTGGSLMSGQRYFYRVSFVDVHGLESLASAEVVATMPGLIPRPVTPTLGENQTGVLKPGLYYYALTALSDASTAPEESTLSPAASITILEGGGGVLVYSPPLETGVALHAVWRLGPFESGYTRIGTTAETTFTDDGAVTANPCACEPESMPPLATSGSPRYAVAVALNANDQAKVSASDRQVARWRLYRAQTPGGYTARSLVQELTAEPDQPLPNSFLDIGDALAVGNPANSDQRLSLQTFTFDTADELPDASLYPQFYPFLVGETLYAKIDTSWVALGGGGGASAPVFTSPNGSRWRQQVGDDGTISMVATIEPGPPTAPLSV